MATKIRQRELVPWLYCWSYCWHHACTTSAELCNIGRSGAYSWIVRTHCCVCLVLYSVVRKITLLLWDGRRDLPSEPSNTIVVLLAKLISFFRYTSFVPVLVYALFGNSRQLSVGPEALVSIIVGSTIGTIAEANSDLTEGDLQDLVHILSFMVGFCTLFLGIVSYISGVRKNS